MITRHRRLYAGIAAASAAILLAACSSSGGTTGSSGGSPSSSSSGKSVTFVADIGPVNDQGYNEYTYLGVKAGAQKNHIPYHVIQTNSSSDYVANLTEAAKESGLVIVAGFDFGPGLQTVSKQYPNVDFVIEDFSYNPPLPNVQGDVFDASQSSYLGGIVAAGMSKTGTVGFVGGVKESVLEQFLAGYEAGALSFAPNSKFKVEWTGSFTDQSAGKQAGQAEIAQGADVVFAAAGASGLGALQAAKQADKWAIGVDTDQNYIDPNVIVTSVVKNLSTVASDNVTSWVHGKWKAGTVQYNLSNSGVGLSSYHQLASKVPAKVKQAVLAAEQQIKSGAVKVPLTPQFPNGR